jgi:lipopolysaccharide cholinephosphotransferase
MNDEPLNPGSERTSYASNLRQAQAVMFELLLAVRSLCNEHRIQFWLDGGTLLGAARHQGFIPWDDDVDIVMPRPDYERFIEIARQWLPAGMSIQTIELDSRYRRYATPCKIRDRYSRIREVHASAGEESGLFIDIIPLDRFHASGLRGRIDYHLKWLYGRLCALQHATPRHPTNLRSRLGNLAIRWRHRIGVEPILRLYRAWLIRTVAHRNKSISNNYLIGYGFDSYWIRLFHPKDIFPLSTLEFEGEPFPVPANVDGVLRIFYGDWRTPPTEHSRSVPHFEILSIDIRRPPETKKPDSRP